MLNVSNDILTALLSTSIDDRATITITNVGNDFVYPDEKIVEGSLSITLQSSGDGQLELGSTMYSELNVELYDVSTNDYRSDPIKVKYEVKLDDDEYHEVFTRYFVIDTCERIRKNAIKITALDRMTLLEKEVGSQIFTGTSFQILALVNNLLNTTVPLFDIPADGSTPQEFAHLPNITGGLQLSEEESGCHTLRDVVRACLQPIGLFAQPEAGGTQAYLREYHTTKDITITDRQRKDFTYAKYVNEYEMIEITSAQGIIRDDYTHTLSYRGDVTYRLNDAPAWDFGSEEELIQKADNLLDYLTNIEYSPSSLTMWSFPIIECGDMIEVPIDDITVNMIVTNVTWNYRGMTQIQSKGFDPYAGNSGNKTTNRQITVNNNLSKLVQYNVTNSEDLSIGTTHETDLCRISFNTLETTDVLFFGEAILDATATDGDRPVIISIVDQNGDPATLTDSQGNPVTISGITNYNGVTKLKLTYYLDGVEQDYHPEDAYFNGKHILSMFYTMHTTGQGAHLWVVTAKSTDGTVSIPRIHFRGTLMGQNLASAQAWDGGIELFDDIERILPDTISVVAHTETCTVSLLNVAKAQLSDTLTAVAEQAISLKSLTETVTITLEYVDVSYCDTEIYCGEARLL